MALVGLGKLGIACISDCFPKRILYFYLFIYLFICGTGGLFAQAGFQW
jgi:hypothetical protein